MLQKEKIKCGQWNKYIDEFLAANRGRLTQIETVTQGKKKLMTEFEMPLQDLTICTFETGDLITISLGNKQIGYVCSIETPVEIWESYNYEGQAMAAEIVNITREKTILSFKSYF